MTDHGWLLLPEGLPKVEMPKYLVESRWTRCGTLEPGVKVDLPTALWYWNPEVQVALLTGVIIASYSLWDKESLDHLPAVTLSQFSMAGSMLLLLPVALRGSPSPLQSEWRERPGSIIAAGLLAQSAYLLVLIALTTTRISYVAPTREVGIVLGAIMGVVLLREGYGSFRIGGSVLVVAGVLTLALAP